MKRVVPDSIKIIAEELIRRSEPKEKLSLVTSFDYDGMIYLYRDRKYVKLEDAIEEFCRRFYDKYGIDLSQIIEQNLKININKIGEKECLEEKKKQEQEQNTDTQNINRQNTTTWQIE